MVLQFFTTATRTHKAQQSHQCTCVICKQVQHSFSLESVSYLYIRRYFPSRPLSERETSKEQDTVIPLLCLFTSPAGGAQDSRAARACTLDTCRTDVNCITNTVCCIYNDVKHSYLRTIFCYACRVALGYETGQLMQCIFICTRSVRFRECASMFCDTVTPDSTAHSSSGTSCWERAGTLKWTSARIGPTCLCV